jgi:predicted MFS family arabinose efflux permease
MKNRSGNFSALFPLFFTAFIDFIGFGIIIPIAPYYAQKLGASPFEFSMLLVAYSVSQLVMSPILGSLSDRYGRKKILITGLLGEIAGYIIFASAPSLVFLFLGRIISGGTSANLTVIYSMVSDRTDPERRTKAIGIIGAAIGMGFVIGPATGGILSFLGFRTVIYLTSLLSLTNLLLVLRLRESRSMFPALGMNFLREVSSAVRRGRSLFLGLVFVGMGFAIMQATLAYYGEHLFGWASLEVGIVLLILGLEQAVFQFLLIPYISKKAGEIRASEFAMIFFSLGFLILFATPGEYFVLGGLTLLNFGYSLFQTPVISILSQRSSAARGATLGISQSATSLANTVGPGIGGFLFGAVSIGSPYLVSAIFGIIAALTIIVFKNSSTKKARPDENIRYSM